MFGNLVPQAGTEPVSLHWKQGVLAPGPAEKSWEASFSES